MLNRISEIQECRQQVQELIGQANMLSKRLDQLEANETNCLTDSNQTVIQANEDSVSPSPTPPVDNPNLAHSGAIMEKQASAQEKKQVKSNDMESQIGKNVFAILASLLVLIGVGVFVSTIYEQIPEALKIAAIYIFGFVVLIVGLQAYRKGNNKFWLGVSSCGMAELLISIITSYMHFGVISLPVTYVMIILWVIGSFSLTKYHPIVFKTIGYIGFILSTLLGISLLGQDDGVIYVSLLVSFVILSTLFMLSNKECRTLNTVIAFTSTVGLTMFVGLESYIPTYAFGVVCVAATAIVALFNILYLWKANLHKTAYPFYSAVSAVVAWLFILFFEKTIELPLILSITLILWYINNKVVDNLHARLHYAAFMIIVLLINAFRAQGITQIWYCAFAIMSYALYFMTKKRDIAWCGFISFAAFCVFSISTGWSRLIFAAIGTIIFLVANHSKLFKNDSTLQLMWYLLMLFISNQILLKTQTCFHEIWQNNFAFSEVSDGIFYFLLSIGNTAYLHMASRDSEKVVKIGFKSVVLMVIQVILLILCIDLVQSTMWPIAMLGVISSLAIIAHSLLYSWKTNWENKRLVVWHCIKFTIYSWLILMLLGAPSVITHIFLLLFAIATIILGFKISNKAVRIYGLILALLDASSLVLGEINYNNSLQLAIGIILCGGLCFVISFIYSKIAKTLECGQAVDSDKKGDSSVE